MFALTPRLSLRPGWPEDAPELARAIGHEAVVSKLSRVPWPYTEADARWFLAENWTRPGPRFVVTERGRDDRPIGTIGIHHDEGAAEFGYWLTPAAWGRGYATEAGRAVVAIARDALRLPRLRASYFVGNDASARVLGKLGFRPTGRLIAQASRALGREVEAVEMVLELEGERDGALPCPDAMPLAA